jgi:hypothetical protein
MYRQEIIRTFFFVLFFSVGTASLGISVLSVDLVQDYQNRQYMTSSKQSLEEIRELNYEYDALLAQLENDPNLVTRLAPATLGTEQSEPNTVYPKISANTLAAARKAITKSDDQPNEPVLPAWLERSIEPQKRKALFYSGIALVLISFVCFRPAKKVST